MKERYSMTKYIFVTGGVVSSLGKGITAASLGALLKRRGYKVSILKMDPYINVEAWRSVCYMGWSRDRLGSWSL